MNVGASQSEQSPCKHAVIVGAPRSGTTLLATMLGNHPDVLVPVDTYVRRCADIDDQLSRSINKPDCDYTQVAHYLSQHMIRSRYDEFFAQSEGESDVIGWRQMVSRGIDRQLAESGKSIWCDKAPLMVDRIPEMAWLLPGVKVIHAIRDGRAVAVSQRDRQFGDLLVAAQVWKAQLLKANFYGSALGEDYCEVRFDDLLRDPESTLARVCGFLNVEQSSATQVLPDQEPDGNRQYVQSSLQLNKLEQWKESVSKREMRAMERIAGDVLMMHGYELCEYDSAGPFRSLSPLRFLLRTQKSYFRPLFRRSHKAMKSRELVDASRPLGSRIRRFFRQSSELWLSAPLLEQFRKDPRMLDES